MRPEKKYIINNRLVVWISNSGENRKIDVIDKTKKKTDNKCLFVKVCINLNFSRELKMARIPESDYGNSPYKKIMGNNPAIHEKWVGLEEEFFRHPTLGSKLLEQVRRVSAWGQECEY